MAFSYDFKTRTNPYTIRKENQLSRKNVAYSIMCCAFIFIAAFRDKIGGDTIMYMQSWKELPCLGDLTFSYLDNSRYQYGFNLIYSAVKTINDSFVSFQIVHAIIVNVTIFWIISKLTNYRFTAVLLYFILNYLEFNTEILRESLAVCCGIAGYYAFLKERKLIGWLFIALAFAFHVSAVILIIMPIVMKIRYTKTVFWAFLSVVIGSLVIFPNLPDLTPLLALVTGNAETLMEGYDIREIDTHLNLNFFVMFAFKCVAIPFLSLYILRNRCDNILGMALMYVVLYAMSCFTYAFYRFANYFAVFYVIFIASSLVEYIKSITVIHPCKVSVYIVLVCFFIYITQGYLLGLNVTTGEPLYARYFPYKSQFLEIVFGI